jgi:4-amino-4-deoxy-L-arabinose transferase-like glycosyltransferase
MPVMLALPVGRAALLLFLAGLLLYALPAGRRDLWNPDEPRNAEIAREMAASGDWFIPRLNGEPFLEEPPLQYWLTIAAGGGAVSAPSARIPAAVAGSLALVIAFCLGTWLFSRWVGLAGALFLGTAYEFWWLAGRAQVDMLLAFFVALAMAGFAASERFPERRAAGLALFYLASAGGFLAKGLLGAGLPGLAAVTWLLWDRRSLRGHWGHLVAGSIFLLAVIAGWGFVLSRHGGGEMLSEYFVRQHLARFAGGEDHQAPFWYYLGVLPAVFLPWTLLWPVAIVGLRGAKRAEESRWIRLLAAWFLSGFVVFSIASTKRETYLLPLFPPLALLLAAGLERAWDRLPVRRWLRDRSLAFAVLGGLLGAGIPGCAAVWVVMGWRPDAVALTAVALGAAIFAWAFRPGRWRAGNAFPLALPALAAVALGVVALAAFPAVNLRKSARPMADAIRRSAPAGAPIYLYNLPEGTVGNYTFYLGRTLPNLGEKGSGEREALGEVRRIAAAEARPVFILREKDLEKLSKAAGVPLEVIAKDRVGHRWMVAAAPRPRGREEAPR